MLMVSNPFLILILLLMCEMAGLLEQISIQVQSMDNENQPQRVSLAWILHKTYLQLKYSL